MDYYRFHSFCVLLFVVSLKPVQALNANFSIRPSQNFKQFDVSTSDEPILTWMEVVKGPFPNISSTAKNFTIGETVTILIHFIDESFLHDLKVTECWAYDSENSAKAEHKLHLFSSSEDIKIKFFDEWYQKTNPKGSPTKALLYANMRAFKFPDKEEVFINCDVQLCFKICDKWDKKNIN